MRDSPHSQHQTHSRTCYDPPNGPQTAVSSNPSRSLERACSHHGERMTPCQDGIAVLEHLKMDVRSKLCPDGAVIQEWSQPLERLCSCCSEREQPCQDSTVNQEHSNANIGTEKKFKTSAVKYMTAVELDLPGPRMNEPSSPAGLPMHLDSATNSK